MGRSKDSGGKKGDKSDTCGSKLEVDDEAVERIEKKGEGKCETKVRKGDSTAGSKTNDITVAESGINQNVESSNNSYKRDGSKQRTGENEGVKSNAEKGSTEELKKVLRKIIGENVEIEIESRIEDLKREIREGLRLLYDQYEDNRSETEYESDSSHGSDIEEEGKYDKSHSNNNIIGSVEIRDLIRKETRESMKREVDSLREDIRREIKEDIGREMKKMSRLWEIKEKEWKLEKKDLKARLEELEEKHHKQEEEKMNEKEVIKIVEREVEKCKDKNEPSIVNIQREEQITKKLEERLEKMLGEKREEEDNKLEFLNRQAEMNERARRRSNIIIRGGRFDEMNLREEVITFIDNKLKVEVNNIGIIRRIGTGESENGILVKLKSLEDKKKLMRNRRLLRNSAIFLDDDLTKQERYIQKNVREFAKREEARGRKTRRGYMRVESNGRHWRWNEKNSKMEQINF